ncbi:MAG: hypothetical protein FJ308_02700 [Planctomycetes bacterium]|nr:hypothetical protein [Planctomycetota bacterium]
MPVVPISPTTLRIVSGRFAIRMVTRKMAIVGTAVLTIAMLANVPGSGTASAQPPMPPPIQPPASRTPAPSREAMWNTPTPTHYRILSKPTHPHSKSPIFTPEVPLPKIESQSVQPYAYGWFGARTLPNASRHFGYRSTFTQWTIK